MLSSVLLELQVKLNKRENKELSMLPVINFRHLHKTPRNTTEVSIPHMAFILISESKTSPVVRNL